MLLKIELLQLKDFEWFYYSGEDFNEVTKKRPLSFLARYQKSLPIDLTEWIHKNHDNIEEILKEALYNYRKLKVSE